MDYSWAKPGVKVVCVKRDDWRSMRQAQAQKIPATAPSFGETVTIQEVVTVPEGVFLALVEYGKVGAFHISRFRPLVTRSQEHDTALFAPWLNVRELAQ